MLTLDADLSHDPDFVAKMWRARESGDVVIASRYARGGVAYTGAFRGFLSWLLNAFLRRVLSLPVRDLSSGYRLYRRSALEELKFKSTNFEVLEEILVRLYAKGYSVVEVPFTYFPREAGRSHVRLFRFGMDQLRSAARMWKLCNSLESADYDEVPTTASFPSSATGSDAAITSRFRGRAAPAESSMPAAARA